MGWPQICGDHALVPLDHRWNAVGDYDALIKHGDPVGDSRNLNEPPVAIGEFGCRPILVSREPHDWG